MHDSRQFILSLLRRLRWSLRAYLAWDALLQLTLALVVLFWLSYAIDRNLELPAAGRVFVFLVATWALAWLVSRTMTRPLKVPLTNDDLAIMLERRDPGLQGSLITAVQVPHTGDQDPSHEGMLAATVSKASGHVTQLRARRLLNMERLTLRTILALLAVGTLVTFGVVQPALAKLWWNRNILLSDELWPRRTHLSLAGFDDQRRAVVAIGADFTLNAFADTQSPDAVIPDFVELRPVDATQPSVRLGKDGVAASGSGEPQRYAYTLRTLLTSQQFFIVGGDDRIGPFTLDALQAPTLGELTFFATYPAYTHLADRQLTLSGLTQVPVGTHGVLLGKASKPLSKVQVERIAADGAHESKLTDFAPSDSDCQTVQVELPPILVDTQYIFTLWDRDGLQCRQPIQVSLAAAADQPPQVNVQFAGVGRAVTPRAQLPAAGAVKDDFGIARIDFQTKVDTESPTRTSIPFSESEPTETDVAASFDVGGLKLQPKQSLRIAVVAEDNSALEEGRHTASGPESQLLVVSPGDLLVMLQAREFTLRLRLETILEEFTLTRNLLAELRGGEVELPPATAPTPGQPVEDEATRLQTAKARRVLQLQRVHQNGSRATEELRQLTTAVDDIALEMVNNRLDSPGSLDRLRGGIAGPLREVVGRSLPDWIGKVKWLEGKLANEEAFAGGQKTATELADAIIGQMREALAQMIQMESYAEVVDLLRDIIDAQAQLTKATKDRARRQLLEDE